MNAGDAMTKTFGRAPGFGDQLALPGLLLRLNRRNLGYDA